MRHTLWVVMLGVVCLGVSGCGKSDDQAPVATVVAPPAQPEEVLQQFLTSVKAGDKAKAENLLTTLAREKTAAEGIGIGNLSNAGVSFEIQGVQPLVMPDGKEAAHVSCVFTEKQEDGKSESHNIIWALRKETVGWRVAGMAWTPFAGEPPIFMDFEDPADMLRKQELLAEEQERRANPQSTKPATTVAGTPASGTPVAGSPINGTPAMTQPNPVAGQMSPGVIQAGNTSPVTTNPAAIDLNPQPPVGPQNAERFIAPAPLR